MALQKGKSLVYRRTVSRMNGASKSPEKLPQLTHPDIIPMYERGALSVSVFYRRHILLALCELAAKAKGCMTRSGRWRLKRFRAVLESMEGNDEIEITGETFCEIVMLAMAAFDL